MDKKPLLDSIQYKYALQVRIYMIGRLLPENRSQQIQPSDLHKSLK